MIKSRTHKTLEAQLDFSFFKNVEPKHPIRNQNACFKNKRMEENILKFLWLLGPWDGSVVRGQATCLHGAAPSKRLHVHEPQQSPRKLAIVLLLSEGSCRLNEVMYLKVLVWL